MAVVAQKNFKYFDIILGLFVAVLIISNIASVKIVDLWRFTFDGGTLLFPLVYIFGDILTEVYGYRKSRRVIWMGFLATALMSILLLIVGMLPASADWPYQNEYNIILGISIRIVIASLIAYFVGEFSNSYILAKMKVWLKGKKLWMRTIGSTIIGEAVDTMLFCFIAFYGILPMNVLWMIVASNYIFKCLVEIIFTPVTYVIVRFLKSREHEDYYDYKTDFNPFKISEK